MAQWELRKIELVVEGMTCENCETSIVSKIKQIEDVERVFAHHNSGKAEVYARRDISEEEFVQALSEFNYKISIWHERENAELFPVDQKKTRTSLIKAVAVIAFVIGIYLVVGQLNFLPKVDNLPQNNLWVIFITGLSVGGLTCLVVQGGLLASVIAQREEEDLESGHAKRHSLWSTAAFLGSKLFAYSILGFGLGSFGQTLSLTPKVQSIMQLVAGTYMILVAFNLFNLHPIFRYVIIQPPRFLARIVRNQSKSRDLFAPGFLGLLTIFIPCGTTVAMEALAIASASPFTGATIMAVFVAGTMPLFFTLGFLTTTLGDAFRSKFFKLAAIGVLYLGLISINGSLVALGSKVTFQSIGQKLPKMNFNREAKASLTKGLSGQVEIVGGKQIANINVLPNGYSPSKVTVKAGVPVKMNLTPVGRLGCTSSFIIPAFGVNKLLTGPDSVEFTPTEPGNVVFSCGMGMYRGILEVV